MTDVLQIGPHICCRDKDLLAKDWSESSCEPRQLGSAVLERGFRIAEHSSLGPAEGQAQETVLQGHRVSQQTDLLLCDALVQADPTMGAAVKERVDNQVTDNPLLVSSRDVQTRGSIHSIG
jgi:hypothetical protein